MVWGRVMPIFGWLRPLRREAWRLAPDWRDWHRFMSTQALGLGTTVLSVGIYLEWPARSLLIILAVTVAMTLAGSLLEQPEIDDG